MLSAEERDVVEVVRAWVDREVRPVAQELDHGNVYPEKLIEGMKQLGIFGLAIPEPWGEAPVSMPCYALVTAELARGWMSLAGAMGGHTVVAKLLLAFGTDEQQAAVPAAHGDRRGAGHDGAHRAGRRLRPAGDDDHRPPPRGRLRRRRRQDLDHQLAPLPGHRAALQDRPERRAPPPRHLDPARRARAWAHRLEGPAQARLQGRRELRAPLRRPPRARVRAARRGRGARASRR